MPPSENQQRSSPREVFSEDVVAHYVNTARVEQEEYDDSPEQTFQDVTIYGYVATTSISTLCWPRGMPTRMMVLL